jgi:hypothetical protein
VDREDIRNNVRLTSVIEDTNVSDTEINLLIDQALHEISVASEWPFLFESATITTVDGTQNYALPGTYLYGYSLVDDDNDRNVPYIAPATFFATRGKDTGNESGTATAFTIQEGNIWLTPIPSAADTDRYILYFYKEITVLASDSAIPEFHEGFHWMIVEYVKWKLYDREEYYDQAERSFIVFSRYLGAMMQWYNAQFRGYPMLWGDGLPRRRDYPNLALDIGF